MVSEDYLGMNDQLVLAVSHFLSRTEEPTKASTCARDRRALQQLALHVHVKHSDLTCVSLQAAEITSIF